MSYKSLIVSDYPISYYPLDDFKESYFPDCIDYSGSANNGTYVGSSTLNTTPLVYGNKFAHKIDNSHSVSLSILNDYSGNSGQGGLATKYYSDNEFSLEGWIYPSISTNDLIPVVADISNDVGLFYKEGNIIFNLGDESLEYTLASLDKSFYIVATYSNNLISIYIDSELVAYKALSSFRFINTDIEFQIGPTDNINDYFLINSVAIYRYSLDKLQIKNHYIAANAMPSNQICFPENGRLFEVFDNSISKKYSYSYPANKQWNYFITDELYYNPNYQELSIVKTDTQEIKEVEIIDFISIPSGSTVDSSKIEWHGTNGITVFVSLDGETYVECTNNCPIPGYQLEDFNEDINFYVKIVLSTTDSSRIIPRISYLSFSFYRNQIFYSSNSGEYIQTMIEEPIATSLDISLGNKKYPILSRNTNNGITAFTGSGFKIKPELPVSTIEFFYTSSSLDASGLFTVKGAGGLYNNGPQYTWDSLGDITSLNVTYIYVNGIDKTSETNISDVLSENEIHHIVLIMEDPVLTEIEFNVSEDGSVKALYQNIALYSEQFTQALAVKHYSLYTGNFVSTADDSSFSLTENPIKYYNNDWKVIQTI